MLALVLWAAPAGAWESECRRGDIRQSRMQDSICHPERFQTCGEGLDAARGTQWGEHALITFLALERAGLGEFARRRDVLPTYYAAPLSYTPEGGAPFGSLAPAPPGAELVEVSRPLALVEASQVPDVSYSMADFLLGNEHCFLANAKRETLADIQACHTYFTHLGPVNSTHFLPQGRAVYERYHTIALKVAASCKRMRAKLPEAREKLGPDRVAALERGIDSCDMQALAFEAVGAHYLEDAWSSGHMWERWGTPQFPPTAVGQYASAAVGAISGLQHGWRAVADGPLKLSGTGAEHDRLCYPGPFPGETDDASAVYWRQPGSDAVVVGGGDDYLLGCKSVDPAWSLLEGDKLRLQRERMIACVARGFHDVFAATREGVMTPAGLSQVDATGDGCWSQRVTNRSFYEGTGVTAWRGSSDPAVLARMVVRAHTKNPVLRQALDEFVSSVSMPLRADMAAMQTYVIWRAWRAPEETDLADLPGFTMGQILTFKRNSAYKDLIEKGLVSYYEETEPKYWRGEFPQAPVECRSDADCLATEYCGPPAGGAKKKACYPMEAAFMNAWREAHLENWCMQDSYEGLTAMAMRCRDSGNRSSAACDACVQAILPKLQDTREGEPPGPSLCDVVIGFTQASFRRTFEPKKAGDALRIAREACAGDTPDKPVEISGYWQSPQACVRVMQTESSVTAGLLYPNKKLGSLRGTLQGRKLTFEWSGVGQKGTGTLTVGGDGSSMTGRYEVEGGEGGSWRLTKRDSPCEGDNVRMPWGWRVEFVARGIWHWESRKCTRIRTLDFPNLEGWEGRAEEAWAKAVKGYQTCKTKGRCNRASGPYARYWYPQQWSKRVTPIWERPPPFSSRRAKTEWKECEGVVGGPLHRPPGLEP